jgi:hypothetical protein
LKVRPSKCHGHISSYPSSLPLFLPAFSEERYGSIFYCRPILHDLIFGKQKATFLSPPVLERCARVFSSNTEKFRIQFEQRASLPLHEDYFGLNSVLETKPFKRIQLKDVMHKVIRLRKTAFLL